MNQITVVVEIPVGSNVKYELENGELWFDRELPNFLVYPVNYGYVPNTLAEDGDALDGLLVHSTPLLPKTHVRARILGIMMMEDEKGLDHKIVCVPEKSPYRKMEDLSPDFIPKCSYFFSHYKKFDEGKWSKVLGWGDVTKALEVLKESESNYLDKNIR